MVVALVCAVVAVVPGLRLVPQPAEGGPAIPRGVELPYSWQATVDMAPPGPAMVLFGGDSLALSSDPFEEDGGKLAVVGRDGAYRMLRYPNDGLRAGQDVRLSPDGNLVAQSMLTGGPAAGWLVVTDLRTGRSRGYGDGPPACCFEVAAWRPDSGAVLVLHGDNNHHDPATDRPLAQYVLVDVASGALLPVDDVFTRDPTASAWVAAFSPDGRGFVATRPTTDGTELRGYDATGRRRWTRDLGQRRLAGAGAYTPDGSAVALLSIDGCPKDCDHDQFLARRWRVTYLDAATGADREGPALPEVTGPAVRALGWHGDALIVVRYEYEDGAQGPDETDPWGTRHVRVLALRPDGTTSVVFDPPADVISVDIAQDLLREGRFGGPVPEPAALPARWSVIAQEAPCLLVPVLIAAAVIVVVWRAVRRRRTAARG
ncbi:hypothetical protein Daura_45475 [Dactylosporangium aurantiacum]|uniref:Uncharacterized protein n=1 Tax=Dactylosporangium aurantiacum TaxID=35754 RepID=A0A9Q9IE49_9ACTN|nr:hypothetical protein [Dactylosporangium aurantiacum]MDG6108058.1 hypothetical protein [Dactylosporangium aurantiacum]UWZ53691.1 hypothetical protein Daura_45475 [Dactylosporangium aurantiacum]